MKLVAYHPAALAELEAEISCCERERTGAGAHVRTDIAESIALIREFPRIGRCDRSGARRIVTRNYRYIIHYEFVGAQITIWAVAHPAREPGYWQSRRAS